MIDVNEKKLKERIKGITLGLFRNSTPESVSEHHCKTPFGPGVDLRRVGKQKEHNLFRSGSSWKEVGRK